MNLGHSTADRPVSTLASRAELIASSVRCGRDAAVPLRQDCGTDAEFSFGSVEGEHRSLQFTIQKEGLRPLLRLDTTDIGLEGDQLTLRGKAAAVEAAGSHCLKTFLF